MAEPANSSHENTPVEKKSNMLMIIIIIVLILIILLGAVGFLLMSSEEEAPVAEAHKAQEKSIAKEKKSPSNSEMDESRKLSDIGILYPLDTFTVNLKSDAGSRYLKVTMSLELEGPELSLELDGKAAVIRDRIIRILTSKSLEEISSKKGKQKVSDQIMDTLNAMIGDGQVKGIYFTEFVIQ